ncbi:MAG: universal stress protein [Planctomycetes bacterium]|nr:universal stress protein [Planctomycetota bacterium]
MLPIHTILHPTDFSPCAMNAFHLASRLARDSEAHLIVLHVMAPPYVAFAEGAIPSHAEFLKYEVQEQLETLQQSADSLTLERRLEEGETVTEILRVANDIVADLVVMGTHGRTGLKRFMMGSIAEQIVRRALCPVLTVSSRCQTSDLMALEVDGRVDLDVAQEAFPSSDSPTRIAQPR